MWREGRGSPEDVQDVEVVEEKTVVLPDLDILTTWTSSTASPCCLSELSPPPLRECRVGTTPGALCASLEEDMFRTLARTPSFSPSRSALPASAQSLDSWAERMRRGCDDAHHRAAGGTGR